MSGSGHRLIIVVALVALDLMVSVLSVTAIVLIHRRDAEQAADQKTNRHGSCVQFNVDQKHQRAAIADGVIDGLRPLISSTSGEAFIEGFSVSLHSSVDAQLPYRDCSDAGIEAFLKNPPQDPATGG